MLKSQQRKVRHMIEQVRDACVRLCRANTSSQCSCLWRIGSAFDCVFCSSAAPELSHGDPGEGPRDQGAGGESGVLGGWGESGSLSPPVIIFYGFSLKYRTEGVKVKDQTQPDFCREVDAPCCLFGLSLFIGFMWTDLWPPCACAEPRDAWSDGLLPGRTKVKFLPFIRAQPPDRLQVTCLACHPLFFYFLLQKHALNTHLFCWFGCCFTIQNNSFLFLSPPSVSHSSPPPHPTNPSLTSKSSRSSHEAAMRGGGELLTRGRQNHQTFSMQTENKHRMWRRGYFGRESWASCSNTSTNMFEPQTLLKESVWCFAAHTQTHTHSDACGVSALVSIYKVYWFSRFEVLHVWYCTRAFPRPALFWLLCYPLSLWQWHCCCCQSRTVEQRAGSGSWHYEVCVQQCSKKRRLSWKFDVKIANQMSCVRLLIQDSVHSAEWMTL